MLKKDFHARKIEINFLVTHLFLIFVDKGIELKAFFIIFARFLNDKNKTWW